MINNDEIPKPNMTPMIDVVFQLLVFFLVSMKFKTLDMKIQANLPKDVGPSPEIVVPKPEVKLVARLDHVAGGEGNISWGQNPNYRKPRKGQCANQLVFRRVVGRNDLVGHSDDEKGRPKAQGLCYRD